MKYPIRCYMVKSRSIETHLFTLDQIIESSDIYGMSMIDVGLVLLNLARIERNLEPFGPDFISECGAV